ncbi:MAG: chemotaxis protein CheW [Oscillospiraceae bacterium]|nr:chemotaxis protein CheW [Oscillospiraceae bacterium]
MDETIDLSDERGTEDKYLTFALGNEHYGMKISLVIDIIMVQAITDVPEVPRYIKGIINLRGKIVPVMDVRCRFNKEELAYNDRTCIIVTNVGGNLVGLIVDMVSEVMDILPEDIALPSQGGPEMQNRYISGIGKTANGVKLLLDIDRLVSDH